MPPRAASAPPPPRPLADVAPPASVQVRVKPHARQSSFEPQPDGSFVAHVKSAPVDGQANEELLRLAARHFGVRRAQVTITGGATSRVKRLRVLG